MRDSRDFHEELSQDVISRAEGEGVFKEEAFFEIVTEWLEAAGEFDDPTRSFYQPPYGGIRVDGYCGDPLETSLSADSDLTLGLICLDFSQSLEPETLTNSDMEADFRRLEKFVAKSNEKDFRESLEPTDPAFGLADLIHARWSKVSQIKLYLLTNKQLSKRVDGKGAGDIEGRTVTYSVWDLERLTRLLESGREREKLIVDFKSLPGGPVRTLLASSPKERNEVYLAAVPGFDLATIYDRWGSRLLEQNVRVFLQTRSKVNKGIKRTLENEPELFFSFNNGITATAEAITTEQTDNGLVITSLDNLQIVNGGQTTASVHAAYKNKKDLSRVYVQMKLSIVNPNDAKELVPRISEYANSQNKVSSADFFANHPFHIRIENFSQTIFAPARQGSFKQTKWFYERARGSYWDAQSYLTPAKKRAFAQDNPKAQSFTKTDLAKYLMAWTDKPFVVNRGAQKNFAEFSKDIADAWDKDDSQFNDVFFKYLVAKKIIFDKTGKIVQEREWYETGGYRSQHVALTVGLISHAAEKMGKSPNFMSIWNAQAISPAFERALGQAADAVHEVLMNPGEGYRNISEWAKQPQCWMRTKTRSVDWDPQWVSELLSLEEEREIRTASKKDQKQTNGIEAQRFVVEAGAKFWQNLLEWCVREGEASEKERGIMKIAASIPSRLPSDKQSLVLLDLWNRLHKEGCPIRPKANKGLRR